MKKQKCLDRLHSTQANDMTSMESGFQPGRNVSGCQGSLHNVIQSSMMLVPPLTPSTAECMSAKFINLGQAMPALVWRTLTLVRGPHQFTQCCHPCEAQGKTLADRSTMHLIPCQILKANEHIPQLIASSRKY